MTHCRIRILSLCAALTVAPILSAQDKPAQGLDALTDDAVMSELARRNMPALLEHAFKVNKITDAQKGAVMASAALTRLEREKDLSLDEQRKLVSDFVKALPSLLPQMRDARSIVADANALIDHGILTDQRLLEYFGPNATLMNRLAPVAAAAQAMFDRAAEAAAAAAVKAESNWPAGKPAWEAADQLKTTAEYTRNILAYTRAIATDPASTDREKQLAAALEYLSQFDTDDNPGRADLKFFIGKLELARGTKAGIDAAKKNFATAIESGDSKNVAQQFDSRLLLVVAELNAKNMSGAQAALEKLVMWSKGASLDKEANVQIGTEALKYRIALLKADLASGGEKEKLASAADDVLDKLQQNRPELRGLILQLMAGRVKADTQVAKLNNLLLQSLLAKAEDETRKPDGEAFDKVAVAKGIEAAREIIKRGDKANQTIIDNCYFVVPFFERKLDKKVPAADGFMTFVERYKKDEKEKERVQTAFNNAIPITSELRKAQSGDAAVTKLIDRVLVAAVNPPFSRMEFAYEYARRLQATGKIDEAIAMYDKVPADSKQKVDSKYFQLVAVHSKLGQLKPAAPARTKLLAQLQSLADEVNASLQNSLSTATGDERLAINTRLAQARLLAGDVALRDQKQPQRAVDLLKDFESAAKGLRDEQSLLSQVLLIRVQAFVQLDKFNEATTELANLAKRDPKGTGQIVYNLLQNLDEKVSAAEAANRTDEVRQLENSRATLTPFLVQWSRGSDVADIKKNAYTYSVYDADTQRRAAELTLDAGKKKTLLEASIKRFTELQSPDALKQFLDLQPPERRAKMRYDPQVKLGLGRAQFALGDYKNARLAFLELFRDKVLGTATQSVPNPGGGVTDKDNATYWEAMYKLIQSNIELNENLPGMKGLLIEQQLIHGDKLGGERWASEFKALLQKLAVPPPPTTGPTG
ncbi:MAG TPA: hypothetical protein VF624_07915 [Tepidisphaeraceae bacterium]|jgi:hypothetical protein